MTMTPDDVEEVKEIASAIAGAMTETGVSWPLNKRETMAAFILMGLTSRIMPSAVTKTADRSNIIDLGIKVSDEALAKLKEEP